MTHRSLPKLSLAGAAGAIALLIVAALSASAQAAILPHAVGPTKVTPQVAESDASSPEAAPAPPPAPSPSGAPVVPARRGDDGRSGDSGGSSGGFGGDRGVPGGPSGGAGDSGSGRGSTESPWTHRGLDNDLDHLSGNPFRTPGLSDWWSLLVDGLYERLNRLFSWSHVEYEVQGGGSSTSTGPN
jgi:hypothetical protein